MLYHPLAATSASGGLEFMTTMFAFVTFSNVDGNVAYVPVREIMYRYTSEIGNSSFDTNNVRILFWTYVTYL